MMKVYQGNSNTPFYEIDEVDIISTEDPITHVIHFRMCVEYVMTLLEILLSNTQLRYIHLVAGTDFSSDTACTKREIGRLLSTSSSQTELARPYSLRASIMYSASS